MSTNTLHVICVLGHRLNHLGQMTTILKYRLQKCADMYHQLCTNTNNSHVFIVVSGGRIQKKIKTY